MSQFKIVYFNKNYNEIDFILHNSEMDNNPIASKVKLSASVIINRGTLVVLLTPTEYNYSMDDFKNRKAPYMLIIPPKYRSVYQSYNLTSLLEEANKPNSHIITIYYGDYIVDVFAHLYESQAIIDEDEYADDEE